MSTIIKNGTVVTADLTYKADVLIEGGVIAAIGPDLTGSNRQDRNYLLTNILDPNAYVLGDWRLTIVTLTDGRVLSENAGEVVGDTGLLGDDEGLRHGMRAGRLRGHGVPLIRGKVNALS